MVSSLTDVCELGFQSVEVRFSLVCLGKTDPRLVKLQLIKDFHLLLYVMRGMFGYSVSIDLFLVLRILLVRKRVYILKLVELKTKANNKSLVDKFELWSKTEHILNKFY